MQLLKSFELDKELVKRIETEVALAEQAGSSAKLAAVDAKFAVSSRDLSEALQRVGSSASEAGVSFDELLGIVTSVQQTTARGGAVIGNALKTIFTRIERPQVINDLKDFGITVTDVSVWSMGASFCSWLIQLYWVPLTIVKGPEG